MFGVCVGSSMGSGDRVWRAIFSRYFCAWVIVWRVVRVWTYAAMYFHGPDGYRSSASRNRLCSSGIHAAPLLRFATAALLALFAGMRIKWRWSWKNWFCTAVEIVIAGAGGVCMEGARDRSGVGGVRGATQMWE